MRKYIAWGAKIVAALIMLQTLFFKFTAHPDSVYIFTQLGLEPWGRIGIGVMELVASILILISRTAWLGAGLSVGLMTGAIFSHLTRLGLVVNNDGGTLFMLAVVTLICSLVALFIHKSDIPFLNLKP